MKKWWCIAAALVAVVAAVSLYSQGRVGAAERRMPAGESFRILLGVTDREPASWDGSITAGQGELAIRGWRFVGGDSTDGAGSWKCSSRYGAPNNANAAAPMLPNGVIITASSNGPFAVKTAQGNFSFSAADIPWGEDKAFLDGRVVVDRVPTMAQLTDSTEDQDFPAVAQTDDTVYLSYVEFVHADRSLEGNRQLTEAPRNFDALSRPAGGDQVFLMSYSKAKRVWSPPMPVSLPKQDVMRTAVAVDGQKRVWVFWSAQRDGNFDIYAKALANGTWTRELRISSDPGTDIDPVAATDSSGRVWIAWQGFRKDNLEVLAAVQNGDTFSGESVISFSRNSDWEPSIATAANGEVAVAWDTYDKGDYDVYFRRLRAQGNGIQADAPVAVAASPKFEARASAAYDKQNRLWIAYEASEVKWGKDFGAYETTGVALYQNHTVKVKCFQGNTAFDPAGDLAGSIPGAINAQALRRRNGKRARAALAAANAAGATLPNPQIAGNRQPSGNAVPPPLPMNSFPKIATDPSGGVYLTFRTPMPGRGALGTAWEQNVAYLEGGEWKGTVTIPNSDYWLDMRAAITAIGPGDLLVVSASDHRFAAGVAGGGRGGAPKQKKTLEQKQAAKKQKAKGDQAAALQAALNADLYAAEFRFGTGRAAEAKVAPAEKVPAPDREIVAEREQIKLMRDYRVALAAGKLQIMRGEFHRHTEISGDGGRDGPLVDAYRYMIDAADMDWGACCDHDNGAGREYSWWLEQKFTDAYHLGSRYTAMFGYERSVVYPEGHRNLVMARRGVRPLSRLPLTDPEAHNTPAPDTQMLYRYLRQFGAIVASHTSGTNMGTDWRDNDPVVEPVVEIYQGDRQNYEMPNAPRSNSANDSIGGWQPLGFVSLALQKGYRLGFQASSDHISTHMSYCNLWVTSPTREAVMEAFHKRRVYGATDNILADVRCAGHFMGEEFSVSERPAISVKLWGTAKFAKVHIIKDGEYVYSIEPGKENVDFTWRDNAAVKGKTSYYYVRGEQQDGELVWVSPMWIKVL